MDKRVLGSGLALGFLTAIITIGLILRSHSHQEKSPSMRFELAAAPQDEVKYWTCGMHPQIRSDSPDNCPICNMELVPIYETRVHPEEHLEEETTVVKLTPREIALAGIKSEPVVYRHLFKEIRAFGKVAFDAELYKAEQEFVQALDTAEKLSNSAVDGIREKASSLVEASRLKLRLQGLSDDQINKLTEQRSPDRSLIISDAESPYVWVYAEIYENELSWIKLNQPIRVKAVSFPDLDFFGHIEAIHPSVNPLTRTVQIRARIENPHLKLKPNMYVDVFIKADIAGAGGKHKMQLAVPKQAVLDTGIRKIVYLDRGNGSFLPREIEVGPEGSAYVDGGVQRFYPVVAGLREGDLVVTSGNFLIDSERELTGIEAAAYGGALGVGEQNRSHKH